MLNAYQRLFVNQTGELKRKTSYIYIYKTRRHAKKALYMM